MTTKAFTSIEYNHLNLPSKVSKSATEYIIYTYDATGRKLSQQVFGTTPKTTHYIGDLQYEGNSLQFISHSEGRAVPDNSPGAPDPWEYQYFLKDHLGNTRVVFSEKKSATEYKATLEADRQGQEQQSFKKYNSLGVLNLFDHTDEGSMYTKSHLLHGGANYQVGLAKSLTVNPGDVVDLEVYAKYEVLESPPPNNVSALLSSLVSAFSLGAGTTPLDGSQAQTAFNNLFPAGAPWINSSKWDPAAPKAYLNYILFDENFQLADFGFDQISTNAAQSGLSPDVDHDYLSLHVKVQQKGYLYIYLSNEDPVQTNIYFDDLKIVHYTAVEQISDYYPFGLTFNSYSRENSVPNKFKFQEQEHIDDLGLNWDAFKWRNHQPDIGRFFNIDPLADKYVYNSPYAFAENRVIDGRELEGLEWVNSTGQKVYDPKANDGKGGYTEQANKNDRHFGGSLQGTATGGEQFSKLVNAKHPIEIKANFDSKIVYSDKAKTKVEYGKTDNERITEFDISTKQVEVTMEKSTIAINIETIDQAAKKGGTFGKMNITNMTFDEILGAVLGHEIEHTTPENNKISATGRDAEAPAYKVSDRIINETWKNIENEEKKQKN
jgi:RHS repeat-associated protein